MYEKIKKWYMQGLWSGEMVQTAMEKGILTQAQFAEILSEEV